MADSAIEVWNTAAKHYKTSYNAWISYTDALMYVYSPYLPAAVQLNLHVEKTASMTKRARLSWICT
jgi:hypothetical protein